MCSCRARVVVAVGLDNVVLDQRVLGPPIDGEVAVTARVKGAGVGDGPNLLAESLKRIRLSILSAAWVPSFSTDKVAHVVPFDSVGATIAVGVGHVTATISPEGVVVATTCTSGAGSRTLGQRSLSDTLVGGSSESCDG